MSRVDHDVVIVGAGLVGLALAVALARAGLSVALADRGNVAAADAPSAATWDARVYAISPGSAVFLHGQGAWQTLPSERVAAVEAMEIFGDAGGRLRFDAYDLGERALAWIVENRELNAALVATVRTEPRIEVLAPCVPSATPCASMSCACRRSHGDRASRRRRRWHALVGARRGRPAA
jgi:2-polyprenyl-6-methoxyphenol hydroxylase-like FAD-dependent oxidoreductase